MSSKFVAGCKVLVVIVGPTAVGKSELALQLAVRLSGEIVSADSRQIYRYMDIGTAKPTLEEQGTVRHHLIDVVDPDQEYTLASFQRDAYRAIDDILSRGKIPLLVGGTGLYVKAVVEGLTIPEVPPDVSFRERMEDLARREGPETLHRQLETVDPAAARKIDRRNVRRVIRALEVFHVTGQPITELQSAQPPPYKIMTIGLTCDRAELYWRIDERVDKQIERGLVAETRRLVGMGYAYDLPSMSGLGYRQVVMYLRGEIDLPAAIQLTKHETHRFVRQQYSWFRIDNPRIVWINREPRIISLAESLLREHIAGCSPEH